MLALARYFAKRERRRDLYFVMATGHFQLPQFIRKISDRFVIGNDAISRWMYDHPEIYPNALAGVTMEHLGCTMWADNADGEYVATGGYEWGSTYTTPRQGSVSVINYNLQQAYLDAVRATSHYGDVPPGRHNAAGAAFLRRGRTALRRWAWDGFLCPLPTYLLQAGSRTQPPY